MSAFQVGDKVMVTFGCENHEQDFGKLGVVKEAPELTSIIGVLFDGETSISQRYNESSLTLIERPKPAEEHKPEHKHKEPTEEKSHSTVYHAAHTHKHK